MNAFRSRLARTPVLTFLALLAACSAGQQGPTGAFIPQVRAGAVAQPDTAATMYVVSFPDDAILGFPASADGNVTPSVKIAGSNTQINGASVLAVDPASGKIYTANEYPDARVLIFPKGANGNVAPKVLGGSNVPIRNAGGMAVDSSGRLYVSDYTNKAVYVFAAGATGNVAPIRTIGGSNTEMVEPSGLSFDSSSHLYVTNVRDSAAPIEEFAANADGNVAPIATIGGSHVKIGGLYNVSLDPQNRIVCAYGGELKVFAAGAHGNVAPIAVIKGSATQLVDATTVGTSSNSTIYATNLIDIAHGKASIVEFASGANGNVAPVRVIAGSHTDVFDTWFPSFF
ncbi:MAG: hypothetical protein WA814_02110 [Candidatus Baltobacteraceae bacterium]